MPGESHRQRSTEGCSPWSRRELDMIEATWHAHIVEFQCYVNFCYIVIHYTHTHTHTHSFSYYFPLWFIKSVQLLSRMTNSFQPHGLQHARLPCPSPNPSPSSQWYHPTISSSVVPFSSSLQSFPASRSFPMSQFFASGGQSIVVSASASVLPKNISLSNEYPNEWYQYFWKLVFFFPYNMLVTCLHFFFFGCFYWKLIF